MKYGISNATIERVGVVKPAKRGIEKMLADVGPNALGSSPTRQRRGQDEIRNEQGVPGNFLFYRIGDLEVAETNSTDSQASSERKVRNIARDERQTMGHPQVPTGMRPSRPWAAPSLASRHGSTPCLGDLRWSTERIRPSKRTGNSSFSHPPAGCAALPPPCALLRNATQPARSR